MSSKRHPTAGSLGINYFKLSRLKKKFRQVWFCTSAQSGWLKILRKIRCPYTEKQKKGSRVFPCAYHVASIEIEFCVKHLNACVLCDRQNDLVWFSG